MKPISTIKRILAAASFALCMAATFSCAKEEMSEPTPVVQDRKLVEMTFVASQLEVKSTFSENRVNWETGDKVAVYDGFAKREFTVASVSSGIATLTGLVAEEATGYHAVYPYSAAREALPADGKINVCLPDVQELASDKKFDEDAFVMVGKVDGNNHISFRNIVSLLKLNIPEGVASVTMKGYASEGISGAATATPEDVPAVSTLKGFSTSVVLKPTGETFDAGVHYIAVLPVQFKTGFKVVYQKAGNQMAIKKTTADVTFPINGGKDITAATAADKLTWIANPLMTEADLLSYVGNQTAYDGEPAKLGTDITLTNDWTPVDLTGILDGQGYTISGLKVAVEGGAIAAMFSVNSGAVLKNVTVEGTISCTNLDKSGRPAGLVGYLNGTMYNVTNRTDVSATCSFDQIYCGGLAGYVTGSMIDCTNEGTVTLGDCNKMGYAGGAAGLTFSEDALIQGCVNKGTVISNGAHTNGLGGVVGVHEGGSVIGCVNSGKVVANSVLDAGGVGGVIGTVYNYYSTVAEVHQCSNEGTIEGTAVNMQGVGGIVGKFDNGATTATEITECENKSSISVTLSKTGVTNKINGCYVGGIVGCMSDNTTAVVNVIKDCRNSGNLSAKSSAGSNNAIKVGGICGNTRGVVIVEGNENKAESVEIEVANAMGSVCSAGGIIGEAGDPWTYEATNVTVKGNVNRSAVSSKTNAAYSPAGGVVGSAFDPVSLQSNRNFGNVTRTITDGASPDLGSCFAGGLVGMFWLSDSQRLNASFNGDMTFGTVRSEGRSGILFGGMYSKSQAEFSITDCVVGGRLERGYPDDLTMDVTADKLETMVSGGADSGYLWGYLATGRYGLTQSGYKTGDGTAYSAADQLTAWQKGYMDIHHISTGRGNCAFMILPDGTTMMVDAGDSGREADTEAKLDCMPDATRTPGEWIVRYVSHFLDEAGLPSTSLDHFLVTHFHNDHMGTANGDYPVSPDGYYMAGSIYVGSTLEVGNFVDRGYPSYDFPYTGCFDGKVMMSNYFNFINSSCSRLKSKAGFMVGSTTQFDLQKDPTAYSDFSISNIYCNGELWDGSTVKRLIPSDAAQAELKDENLWSAVINVKYGSFDYHTGGDILVGDAAWNNIEDAVGKAIGETDVVLCNHHACDDAMSESFLEATEPQACVIPAWENTQPGTEALARMSGTHVYAAGPVSDDLALTSGHVVVRVYEGGDEFQIFVLDDASTDYKLIHTSEKFTSK
ncbi:MAG: hypothetical protein IJX11_03240 [Bacteroidales bacterium]|nr:hypothetical protein [Bacteroidales bacterium]